MLQGYVNPDDGSVIVLPNGICPSDNITQGTCGTYSDPNVADTPTTTSAAAPAFWATLQGFMGAFPQYSRETFHFSTGTCRPLCGTISDCWHQLLAQRATVDTTGRFSMNTSKVKTLKPFLVLITSASKRSLLAMGGTIHWFRWAPCKYTSKDDGLIHNAQYQAYYNFTVSCPS